MKPRVVVPVFLAAVHLLVFTVLTVFAMFMYGGDATAVLAFFWLMSVFQYGLVREAANGGGE